MEIRSTYSNLFYHPMTSIHLINCTIKETSRILLTSCGFPMFSCLSNRKYNQAFIILCRTIANILFTAVSVLKRNHSKSFESYYALTRRGVVGQRDTALYEIVSARRRTCFTGVTARQRVVRNCVSATACFTCVTAQ